MFGLEGGITVRRAAVVVAAAVAMGCSGSDDGPSGNPKSVQVAVSPATLSVEQGGTGNVTATLTRGGGFDAAVTIAVTGLPTGVVPTVTPAQLTGATTQAQIAVAVASTVTPGTYTATITASATGVGSATTTYQLTVTAAPTYTLTMAPAALTVAAGSNGQATVNIDRTNFAAGNVTLALVTPPAGITGTFAPNPSTTNASALTVAVDAAVQPGVYNLTIQGTGAPGVRTTPLALTVTAQPAYALVANPNTVTATSGGTANTSIDITRTNFAGAITLALDAPPAGITATFNPSPTTANASAMTINVDASVTAGTYQLSVKGTATGLTDRSTQVTVNVQAPAAAFTLNLASNTLSVVQGSTGSVNITLARTNFTGSVSFAYEGGASGITGSVTPTSTTGNTAVFNYTVPANTAPGIYSLTIRGTATGLTDRVATLQMTVTATPASIALVAAPTALTVTQGQSGNVSLTLTRTNFTGQVTFAATNVPAGVTPTFTPTSTTGNTSTLGLAVAPQANLSTTPITITASGAGVTNAVVQVSLTVAPPVSGGNTEFQFCSASETPIFFAAQDGSGAWQRVTGSTTGSVTKFTFNITQNRGGVMYVHQRSSAIRADALVVNRTTNRATLALAMNERKRSARSTLAGARNRTYARSSFVDFYETTVLFASAAELAQVGTDNCSSSQATKTVTGTVAGVGADEFGLLSLGSSFTFFIGGISSNPVEFTDVPPGTLDFVGSRTNDQGVMDRTVVFRNLNIADGGSLPQTIDFAGSASAAPASATLTVTNTQGHEVSALTTLTTANNLFTILSLGGPADVVTSVPWYGLAPSVSIGTDIHGLLVSASPTGSQATDERTVFKYVGAVANQTLALGPTFTPPTSTQLAAAPYPRFRFQGTLPVEYQKFIDLQLEPQNASGNSMNISATGAYLAAAGSASSYDLSVPDVSALAGFPLVSRLTAGGNGLETTVMGWSGNGIIQPLPQVGQELKMAAKSSVVTVP